MRQKTELSDFRFKFIGNGHYGVTYVSPVTKKAFRALINDMPIIDATKNSDTPLRSDLDHLKKLCKR